MVKNLLEVNNLLIKVNKNKKEIVKDISFCIKKYSSLGIIGESGSGKTMTAKSILRLLDKKVFSVNGNIIFNDIELTKLKTKDINDIRGKKIGMIMQNPMTAFAPTIKIGKQVIDTLTFQLKLSKKEAYYKIIEEMKNMNLSNCEKIMNSYSHQLSGGMLQRVMIALTLSLKPQLIIADEATTAVDSISEKIILEELKRIKENGISLLVITHDFGIVATLSDELVVMRNGEIIERGITKKVLTCPENFYTRELIESSILDKGGKSYASSRKYCENLC